MMKPVKAWAVIVDDKLAMFRYTLPITWLRRLAQEDAEEAGARFRVIRVEIREVPKRKAK